MKQTQDGQEGGPCWCQMKNKKCRYCFLMFTSFSLITKPIFRMTPSVGSITLSLGSVLSLLQDSTLLPAGPGSPTWPLLLSGVCRSVFGGVEERVRGTRVRLGWCLFAPVVSLSWGPEEVPVELWFDPGERRHRSCSWAWDKAAVSSSLSSHSLLTVSCRNATYSRTIKRENAKKQLKTTPNIV